MADAPIRVLLADDHPVVRRGLRSFLDLQDDVDVVGEAGDGDEALRMIAELAPDVVLLDIEMPGRSGLEVLRELAAAGSDTRVVVLTSFTGEDQVLPAVEAGAAGYLLKDVHPFDLRDAIRRVHGGEEVLAPSVAGQVMRGYRRSRQAGALDRLTSRELDVLRLIAAGRSNRQIGRKLGITEKTVKTHVSNLLAKLGVEDRTQAAVLAVREGLAAEP